jgi:transketolase
MYSIKPIDHQALADAVEDTRGRLVITEDHHPERGLGSAVFEALSSHSASLQLAHLAVRIMPGSGEPAELLAQAGLDSTSIERAARQLLDDWSGLSLASTGGR